MMDETIALLTYYYNQEDRNHKVLRHIIKTYCPAYLPWDIYLYQPLQKTFSRVILYDYLKRRVQIGIKAMNQEIIELVRKEKVKYVLWTSFYYDVLESTLDTLRKDGATVVGWFFDDEWRFDTYSKYWIPHLDYCVTNSIEAVPRYKALNARVINTIPNTGITIDHNWSDVKEQFDVTFVGSTNFVDRMQHINKLKERKISVQLFGGESSGYVPFKRMMEIFQTSKINLNFSKCGSYHRVRQIKGRVFQVCLAGGFMLTEYAPGIDKYFKIDKEIACFKDEGEMLDKVAYYLENEDERRAIARAGWERATSEHTSYHMVNRVFDGIERKLASADEANPAKPIVLKMPLITRTIFPSDYHFQWGRALLLENYDKSQWKDALSRSLAYSPLNISAWYYRAVGNIPSLIRPPLFQLHDTVVKIPGALIRRLRSVPLIGRLVRRLMKQIV